MPESSIEVIYIDRPSVETFLGRDGTEYFRKELDFILEFIKRQGWPLVKVEIDYWTDMEISSWHTVEVLMYFYSTFTEADKWLRVLYKELDMRDATLDAKEYEYMLGKIYLNVQGLIPEES